MAEPRQADDPVARLLAFLEEVRLARQALSGAQASLDHRADALTSEVAGAETQRNAAAAAVEQALGAVELIRADTEAKVQTATTWQEAKRAFDEAEAVATEAEKKATSAEAELGAKRKPYDDDPLFAGRGMGLIESWTAAKKPVEFHLYGQGGHGFGMYPKETTSTGWFDAFYKWIVMNGFTKKPAA